MKIVLGIAVFVLVAFFIISFAFLSAEEFGDEWDNQTGRFAK